MATVKKPKVLKFKNTPIKKEQKEKIVKKKKEVVVPTIVSQPVVAQTLPSNPIVADLLTPAYRPPFPGRDKIGNFPRISRFITEKWFLMGLACGILLFGIIIVAGNIQTNMEEKKSLELKRSKIQQEITYWQENARKYPGYRDAYFQLALLEYQLGNAQSAQSYLNKAKSIDPNFQEAYKLEKLLKAN